MAFAAVVILNVKTTVAAGPLHVANGSIDNQGVAEVLNAFVDHVGAAIARDNTTAATKTLEAFIRFVRAQSGKHIDAVAAQTLIDLAQAVIDQVS